PAVNPPRSLSFLSRFDGGGEGDVARILSSARFRGRGHGWLLSHRFREIHGFYVANEPSPWRPSFRHMLAEQISQVRSDFIAIRFQSEVASVEQVELQRLQVAFVRLCPLSRKDLVVPAPDDQHRGLVLAEIRLPLRIQRRIAAVTQEQVELYFVVPRPVEQK